MATERGFTLLEVLVAFVIATLALVVLFRTAGVSFVSAHTAGRYEEAVSRARSRLDSIPQDPTQIEGELTGDDGGGFRWRLAMVPVDTTKPPANADDDNDSARPAPPVPLTLYAVTVTESWSEGGRTREVSLHTQRLGLKSGADNDRD